MGHSFRLAANGNEITFLVVVNVGAIRRCRERVGIDLYKLFDEGNDALGAVLSDPPRLCDLAFTLVEQQAAAFGVTADAFGAAFSGDALTAAADAIAQAVVDFFPTSQRERARRLLATTKAAGELTAETMVTDLETLGAEGLANAALAEWRKSFAALRSSAAAATQPHTRSGN